jgi:simple sugar transport system ATP-binding protein
MQVLDGFDLSVGRGEVVALMGANGAGKSTLAKIASGVFQPDRGRIFVAGREVRLASPRAAREAGIVIVHQSTDQLGLPVFRWPRTSCMTACAPAVSARSSISA